ncbi:alpha-actinin [Anaeramoeba ignava]|uniref:Alpha-actinin n=1 Tax=Anaeramoeba ignava TaxID=1746090 RepID=A0A9Q0L6F6_ANAIG|nr:alpha-actinin [Anaeramoeba ignava]
MSRTGRTTGPRNQEWVRLQRKIFSRWVKQKLLRTRPEMRINDIVDDYKDGLVLMNLIEVLSESKFEGKYNLRPKMSVHRIDNLNNALKFAWSKGVDMKVKPSAEQIEAGDQKAALALTWGIMMKFIKIDDESGGESLNAKDALLMWCKNKTASYKNVEVTDFKKSFADGLALCAIIHKHRPKLIDWNSLNSNDPIKNLEIAQDAAEKYFGLEKYITPDEIRKLDENSMVIYVSEYYYGIAEQRKLDLAARRIKKLIVLTKENDRLKAEYNKTANNFKATVKKVEKILEDRTIDNTMAGAKRRLEQFYEYKAKDKNSLIADQLDLESNYNNLAMRLSHHKRPEFKPEKGCSLKEVAQDMLHLEECEQERKVALHAELNRQIKLVNISKQHESRYNKLVEYYKQKKAYLEFREEIDSVSAAYFQLSLLDRYEKENQTMINTGVANLKKLSAELKKEKYEYQTKIEEHDKDIDNKFKELDELDKIKRPILDDHLKREEFIEKVRQMNDEHKNKHEQLAKWFEIKKAYLETMEEINSVPEASKNLDIFNSYIKEYKKYQAKNLVEFKKLGEETLKQKYQTKFSEYIYNQTKYQGKTFGKNQFSDITNRHDDMDNKFKELEEFAKQKKAVLDDHLKREEFILSVLRMNTEHEDRFQKLKVWFEDQKTYFNKREKINSVSEANTQLNLYAIYSNDYNTYKANDLVEFKKLGEDTLNQKYQTEFSEYVYHETQYQDKTFGQIQSEDITNRHDDMGNKFNQLAQFSKSKKEYLDESLRVETKKEQLRLAFANAASEFIEFIKLEVENASLREFGFTLEEVEAYRKVIDDTDKQVLENANNKKNGYDNIKKELDQYKVVNNPYTSLTLDDLEKSFDSLKTALSERTQAYEVELKRQRDNDALCKKFAETADPFSKWITEQKDKITASKETLETQLGFVDKLISGLSSEGKRLNPLKDLQDKMDKAGIQNNRHTTLTLKDLEVQWKQYENFLKRKKKMLEEEIEHQKLRGITAEQMQEIEENFKQFDFDNSGTIDRKELTACLYSLGEERTPKEISKIMEEYGDGKDISYERFKDFMIVLFGDTDTKDEIINSFILINRGFKVAKKDLMELVMDDQDIEYVLKTAPQVEDGYDFHTWTEEMFAR